MSIITRQESGKRYPWQSGLSLLQRAAIFIVQGLPYMLLNSIGVYIKRSQPCL